MEQVPFYLEETFANPPLPWRMDQIPLSLKETFTIPPLPLGEGWGEGDDSNIQSKRAKKTVH